MTAISKSTWQLLGKPELNQPNQHLSGPSGQHLQVMDHFLGHLSHKGKEPTQPIFVVKQLYNNLLRLPSITALGLVARMEATSREKAPCEETLTKKFSKVPGVRKPGRGIHNQTYTLFSPRNIPLPLHPQVREELKRMENAGVISKVKEPTPWCAGMVVVPKKSGTVRICVDLKPLNQNVLREVHPLPKVDETLAQLPGARIFSKLDANSGFWQILLAKPSRLLTTLTKQELTKPTTLALYDPDTPTKISADASSHGLGAVLPSSAVMGHMEACCLYIKINV